MYVSVLNVCVCIRQYLLASEEEFIKSMHGPGGVQLEGEYALASSLWEASAIGVASPAQAAPCTTSTRGPWFGPQTTRLSPFEK
jgi:hypothetical protein